MLGPEEKSNHEVKLSLIHYFYQYRDSHRHDGYDYDNEYHHTHFHNLVVIIIHNRQSR